MKITKLVTITTALLLVFALAACGQKSEFETALNQVDKNSWEALIDWYTSEEAQALYAESGLTEVAVTSSDLDGNEIPEELNPDSWSSAYIKQWDYKISGNTLTFIAMFDTEPYFAGTMTQRMTFGDVTLIVGQNFTTSSGSDGSARVTFVNTDDEYAMMQLSLVEELEDGATFDLAKAEAINEQMLEGRDDVTTIQTTEEVSINQKQMFISTFEAQRADETFEGTILMTMALFEHNGRIYQVLYNGTPDSYRAHEADFEQVLNDLEFA